MSVSSSDILASFSFENFELHPKLLQAVHANGFKEPTEIQKAAIPTILKGQDLMASAQTGAGKTVAFVLPSLQLLLNHPPVVKGHGPRVLILTPTRELAQQITHTISGLCKFLPFKFGTITGGVPYPAQEQLLRKPLDLLVATPGRLMDHMERNRVDFKRLSLFILDEADRMLDMGFIKDMEQIAKAIPCKHQTLLFSATLQGSIQKISQQFLHNPALIQLSAAIQPPALISQRIHLVDNFNHKRALLSHVLEETGVWQAIIFTGTKRAADELAEDLSAEGIKCAALHGDMKQSKRTRTLDRMHKGQLQVLVATDVAARGLDVKKLTHVINFDLPRSVEDYVHRIGRTGRCGEKGIAISLVEPKDGAIITQIERLTGQRLERQTIPGLEPKNHLNLSAIKKSKPQQSRKRHSKTAKTHSFSNRSDNRNQSLNTNKTFKSFRSNTAKKGQQRNP